ncbi:MAG TPA: uroporphyrinogen decarboxylase [Acetobacteraceae bacterium]|nr:uroporphyrinogen decarboxylase [Acetobacteraceae bacterium]
MPKPLLRALTGEAVWPPPVWLMRQAGRYLPEYRALRAEAGDFLTLCMTPTLAAEVTLQPVRRFGMDAAILFSDILVVPWALGQALRFVEGEGPSLPPLRDGGALAALRPERLEGAIAPVLDTVARVRAALPGGCALIGFAGSPWTVACYMVEGGGGGDFPAARALAYADPDLFAALIEVLTEATTRYLAAQVEAGAECVMLFDSWAGLLPPALFEALVIDPTETIAAALKQRFPALPVIGFPRLAGGMLSLYAQEAGVDAVGIDTAQELRLAAAMVPEAMALQGNLDPYALLAGGEALRAQAEDILDAARGRPHVFNLGHGILPQTPPEHVAGLVRWVRDA